VEQRHTHTNKYIIASEIKAIQTQEGINDVKIAPKNTLIEIDLATDEFTIHKDFYFKFSNEPTKVTSHKEVGETTFKLLENAVDKRLISDVPIATSLSGGIDSAIITYLLAQRIPDIKAYTIAFDQESKDLQKARVCADAIGVELVEVIVPRDEEIIKQRFMESISCGYKVESYLPNHVKELVYPHHRLQKRTFRLIVVIHLLYIRIR
jgi:asparagine synthetase B (glutamine-hydrolysing)